MVHSHSQYEGSRIAAFVIIVALLWSPFNHTAFAEVPRGGEMETGVIEAEYTEQAVPAVGSGVPEGAPGALEDTSPADVPENALENAAGADVPEQTGAVEREEVAPTDGEPSSDTPLIEEPFDSLLLAPEPPQPQPPQPQSRSESRPEPETDEQAAETQTAPATALTAALATSTNSGDTTDAITSNTEIDIEISHASSYGGTSGDKVHTFYKQAACADVTIPSTAVTVAEPGSGWTQYGSGEDATTAGTTFTVTDGIALAQGTYCFYGAFANGTATSPTTHSTVWR